MDLRGKKIILGSGSPRRQELLKGMDVDFIVDTETDFKEEVIPGAALERVPVLMSEGKSKGFHRALEEDEILITADTMVLCGTEILGKPRTYEDAVSMLGLLSGKEHLVITAVTFRDKAGIHTFTDTTKVWFKDLTKEEASYYVKRYRPYDKAGSYGAQEWIGYIAIEKIEGSYFNVMGFPTHLVYKELFEFLKI